MSEYTKAVKAASISLDDTGQPARTFPDVINEWTNELLRLNNEASIEQVGLILHLGTLGQRLIYEANAIGQNEVLRLVAGAEDIERLLNS